ncbi:MAG: hypothetical protein Q7V88_03035 [Actinomycetota bacterium]|nr:hypothetical protein [Actinomycetota bacterium]
MGDEETVAQLREELASLRAEMAVLRAEVGSVGIGSVEPLPATRSRRSLALAGTTDDGGVASAGEHSEPTSGRRGFVKLAAGAAIGAVAASVAAVEPAAAATGDSLLLGQSNAATANADTTILESVSFTELAQNVFNVGNWTGFTNAADSTWRTAIYATTSDSDASGGHRMAVVGEVRNFGDSNNKGIGVFGAANRSIPVALPTEPIGVLGFADAGGASGNGTGVKGYVNNGSSTIGVHGLTNDTIGVQAQATGAGGIGINAVAPPNALAARVEGRFRQVTSLSSGPPAFAPANAGEQWRDSNGDLYICTTTGIPGTWRKVVSQHPAYADAGGSLNLLAAPIRILDTRGNGAPQTNGGNQLTANVDLTVNITGVVVGAVSVPAGAKGVFGTLTAVGPLVFGNVAVFPADIAFPGTSNVNFRPGGATASAFTTALSAGGAVKVRSSAATHLLLDVTGFLF